MAQLLVICIWRSLSLFMTRRLTLLCYFTAVCCGDGCSLFLPIKQLKLHQESWQKYIKNWKCVPICRTITTQVIKQKKMCSEINTHNDLRWWKSSSFLNMQNYFCIFLFLNGDIDKNIFRHISSLINLCCSY